MLKPSLFVLCSLFYLGVNAQSPIQMALDTLTTGKVDFIQVDDLKKLKDYVLLDTREETEFSVSHLKNAICVGYSQFDLSKTISLFPDKDQPIVVYCSIGARSEEIGEKLKQSGYTQVKNLYGGIFHWKNLGNPVFDSTKKQTDKVHSFSKEWAPLLTNAKKVHTTKNDTIE